MHVCMHACTHVGMYARMYVCMYVRAYKFVCMSTPTTVRMCVSVSICIVQSPGFLKPYLEQPWYLEAVHVASVLRSYPF